MVHVNLPDELYFGILVLFWYLVLPFGRNPLHAQRGTLCDQSFRPVFQFSHDFHFVCLKFEFIRERKKFSSKEKKKKKVEERKIIFVNKFQFRRAGDAYQQHTNGHCKTTKERRPIETVFHYLTFDQHRHVHEHVVQFSDRVLQFDDVGVSCFNVGKSLFSLLCFHNDLNR